MRYAHGLCHSCTAMTSATRLGGDLCHVCKCKQIFWTGWRELVPYEEPCISEKSVRGYLIALNFVGRAQVYQYRAVQVLPLP